MYDGSPVSFSAKSTVDIHLSIHLMLLKIYNQKLFKYFPTVLLSMHHNTVYAQSIITMVIIYNVFSTSSYIMIIPWQHVLL